MYPEVKNAFIHFQDVSNVLFQLIFEVWHGSDVNKNLKRFLCGNILCSYFGKYMYLIFDVAENS